MRCRTTGSHWLLLRPETRSKEPEHLLDLLCRVVLVSTEDIGFGAFSVAKFVNMSLVDVSMAKIPQYLPQVIWEREPGQAAPYHSAIGN